MATPLVHALGIMEDVVNLLTDPDSECALDPQPCRASVAPGGVVAWDYCDRGCSNGLDGQLWGNLQSVQQIPDPSGSASSRCGDFTFTGEIGIVRCMATVKDDGRPPSVDQLIADADRQAVDGDAVWSALACCSERSEEVKDLVVESWRPLGPQGGCGGSIWSVRGAFHACC